MMDPSATLVTYRDGGLWLEANRERLESMRVLQWRPETVPIDPGVERVDLLRPLPVEDRSLAVIVAFHVLEHLDIHEARRFLVDCLRALRPGGVLRVSTPDFSAHLRIYLECLEEYRRRSDDARCRARLEFMRLLLLDQRVRRRSGGRLLACLRDSEVDGDLAERAMGDTGPWMIDLVRRTRPEVATATPKPSMTHRLAKAIRRRLPRRRRVPWWNLDCRDTRELEITTWDSVSLVRELRDAGFVESASRAHEESCVVGLSQLDCCPRTGAPLECSAIAEGRRP